MKQKEYQMCKQFFEIINLYEGKYPELRMLYHIENEGKRTPASGAMAKRIGKKAGILDYCLPVARGGYHGLYIEAKIKPNKLSKYQAIWVENLREQGYYVQVCYTVDKMIEIVKSYLGIND